MQAVPQRRGRSITARIRAMVMIPTTALVVLWLILTATLAVDAVYKSLLARATDDLVTPAAVGLVDAMNERSATIAYIENPDDPELVQKLTEARESTDDSLGAVVDELIGFADLAPGDGGMHIEMLHEMYQDIDAVRESVDSEEFGRTEIFDYYNELILHGADSFDTQGREGNEGDAVSPGFTAIYMFRTVDQLSQADAQLSRAFATDEFTIEDQQEFTQLVGTYETLLDANAHYLVGEGQAERYQQVVDSPEYAQLQQMQQELIHRRVETETVTDPVTLSPETVDDLSVPVDGDAWHDALDPVLSELTDIGADEATHASGEIRSQANSAVFLAVLGSLGVGAIVVTVFFMARRASQNLTDQLLKLRDDSNVLAEERLPAIMERLHRGEQVDTQKALPELEASEDEIGDVARAFNTAQRSAVEEAIQQTELRHGVNRVFLNIAHRNQTLVHRQLRLLDQMEREQEDPEQLAQLFKLDHLATRSRRNAENLLILGGEAPGRTWHRPMPLIDVLRGAISESGDYTRVKRERIARVHLNGPAVADVIHLVAELVDNASMFSPPHTNVHLKSEEVPNGVTVEIEDRGLGMSDTELEAANALLADPPEFDVMRLNEKMRLGLFVVSHLSYRHGISVHLRPSPYGGVQAIVLLPHELISGGRTPLLAGEETDQEVLEIQEVPTTNPDEQNKPVLTSVPTLSDNDSGPEDPPAKTEGNRTTGTPDGTSTPRSDILAEENGSAPPLPTRTSKIDAVTEPPTGNGSSTMVEAGGGRPPLPKRRPQENLAPQLAADPSSSDGDGPAAGSTSSDNAPGSAERLARLRRNMSAFQKGSDRGRRESKQQNHETDKDE